MASAPPDTDAAPRRSRRILHLDMDAFYASVEQRDGPSCAAARSPSAAGPRGAAWSPRPATRPASSASARPSPCRGPSGCARIWSSSGRTSRSTRRRPTGLRPLPAVTPLVEPLSLDEAYLDVTENAWGEPLGMTVARRLKDGDSRAHRSDGVGRRRAQQVPREDRLRLAEARRAHRDRAGARRALPARARRRRAVGRRPGHRPQAAGARHHPAGGRAHRRPGAPAHRRRLARRLAHAAGARPRRPAGRVGALAEVVGQRDARSPTDLTDVAEMRTRWPRWRATRRPGCCGASSVARTVTLKLRYSDFTTITRSHTAAPTQDGDGIERRAVALLDRTEAASRPVRLLGVSVHNFIAARAERAAGGLAAVRASRRTRDGAPAPASGGP